MYTDVTVVPPCTKARWRMAAAVGVEQDLADKNTSFSFSQAHERVHLFLPLPGHYQHLAPES